MGPKHSHTILKCNILNFTCAFISSNYSDLHKTSRFDGNNVKSGSLSKHQFTLNVFQHYFFHQNGQLILLGVIGRLRSHCGWYIYTKIQLSTTFYAFFTTHAKRRISLSGEYFVGAGSRIPHLARFHCI